MTEIRWTEITQMGGSRIRRDGRWEDEDKDADEEERTQFFIIFFQSTSDITYPTEDN
jgi:hypothetical protein